MVNVLISTYNGEQYIGEQLESIRKQSYGNYRVYIRDDGSSDRTVAVIHDFIQRYHLENQYTLMAERNAGFSKSFERLLHTAQEGDYWAFCDQDDYWYPDKLQHAIEWMEQEYADIPLLYHGNFEIGNEDLTKTYPYPICTFLYTYRTSFTSNVFFGFATVINRPLYERLVRADFERVKYHDWFSGMIVTAFGKYKRSDAIEAIHRQHKHNTSPLFFWKKIPDGIKMLRGDDLYTRNAREFYRLFEDELNEEQREICRMFLNERYQPALALRKAFYPKRWNPQWKVEWIIRFFMLIGKI
ncbi:MAG: glycosyltransferase [Lachnospiraceae bacterium]|nr:glycosyltransferase [Lachnospiraceae bacterium]